MQRKVKCAIVAMAVLIAAPALSDDASFPCKSSRSPVEKRICESQYFILKDVDREMAKWYRRALRYADDKAAFRGEQRAWLKSLDQCLTSEKVEPVSFVCDHEKTAEGKLACFRDACILNKYFERTKQLYLLPTQGKPWRYQLTDKWPAGVHDHMWSMAPEDRELCHAVANVVDAAGPFREPLSSKTPLSSVSAATRILWTAVDPIDLCLVKRFEQVLRDAWHHDSSVVESQEFESILRHRIVTGAIVVSWTDTPLFAAKGDIKIIRYQRWRDVEETTPLDLYSGVEFFVIENDDFSNPLWLGHRSADDAFQWQGRLYFYFLSERGFDDNWAPLPVPQPEIYLDRAEIDYKGGFSLETICHLVFTQEPAGGK